MNKKILFHHIPKTAGTTLIASLEQPYAVSDIFPADVFEKLARSVRREDVENRFQEVTQYELIHGHYSAAAFTSLHNEYFTLTFLREPVSRLRSLLNDWRTKSVESLSHAPEEDVITAQRAREWPITQFLTLREWPVNALFDNAMVRLLSGELDKLQLTQADLQVAIERLESFDFVGITECFSTSFTLLMTELGWPENSGQQPLNIAREQRIKDTYDVEARDAIYECTHLDTVLYQHALKVFDEQAAKQLSNRSLNNFPAQHQVIPDHYRLTMDMGFQGTGWHVREGLDTERVWRWTGPDKQSKLLFNIAPEHYVLTIKVISVIDENILWDTNIYLNAHPLKLSWPGHDGVHHLITANIQLGMVEKNASNELLIEVPFTASHASVQPETEDHRQKGLAITEITLQKASEI